MKRLLAFLVVACLSTSAWSADFFWGGETQFFTNAGAPLNAGTINTFDAGTTNNKTVFKETGESNAHTNPVVLDANGRLPAAVYIPEGSWKYVLKDSTGTTIHTEDNVPGGAATVTQAFAKEQCPTSTKTANYTVVVADAGGCFLANAASGGITFTLPSAVTVGDGGQFTFIKTDTSTNAITIATVGSQTIDASASTDLTSYSLPVQHQRLRINSDGANWRVIMSQGFPAGTLMPYGGSTAPAGWLLCDGTTGKDSTTDLSLTALFSVIGTTYGGTGAADFDLPDCTGRVIAGKESSATRLTSAESGIDGGVLGAAGGVEAHAISKAELYRHDHSTTETAHAHGIGSGANFFTSTSTEADCCDGGASTAGTNQATNTDTTSTSLTVDHTGGDGGGTGDELGSTHQNVQPTIVLNWIIKK